MSNEKTITDVIDRQVKRNRELKRMIKETADNLRIIRAGLKERQTRPTTPSP